MARIDVEHLNLLYGRKLALSDINVSINERQITALIGPSGCGKSSFLRCLNRMNDTIRGARVEGKVMLDGDNIYAPDVDVVDLRRRVGMVFQRPNPFPNRSLITSPLGRASSPSVATAGSTTSSRRACAGRTSGTR